MTIQPRRIFRSIDRLVRRWSRVSHRAGPARSADHYAIDVLAAMMLNSWLAEWEDNQPGGFNNPNTDERDTKDR